jgi:hypothetical protein
MVRRVSGGNPIVVGDINENIPIIVRKTTNESAPASTITVQDDDELFFTVEANSIYFVEGLFRYTAASNTPDLRLNYSYPAGASFARFDWGRTPASTATNDVIETSVATTGDAGRGAGTTQTSIFMKGDLQIGGTAGTFRVRFGQVTSSVDLVTMNLGSYLMAWKVS